MAIQDTTELDFTRRSNTVRGLGPIGERKKERIGFYLHPTLAIDPSDDFVYGLAACHHWVRASEVKKRHPTRVKIEDKESYRWISSALEAKETLSSAHMVTIVGDRESDIYDEFCQVRDETTHLLVRSCHDRAVMVDANESTTLRTHLNIFLCTLSLVRRKRSHWCTQFGREILP